MKGETMRKRTIIAATAGAVLLAGLLATAGTAVTRSSRVTVTCGQVLTTSVKLASNLVGCSASGLVVGANGITVDLDGHTVSGTNAAKSEGIANDGHANVKIVNGTVSGFSAYGVALRHAPRSTVRKLTIRRIGAGTKKGVAAAGILVDHSPGSAVVQSVVTNHVHAYQSDGIDVLSSSGVRVQGSRLAQNAWNGLVLIQSPRSTVVANRLDANANNGMEANVGSDSILVSGNRAAGNRAWGIVVGAVRKARVVRNTVSANRREGLFFFDLVSGVIQGNVATGNANGIALMGGQHGSRLNQLVGNRATANKGAGIWVTGDNDESPARGNILSGNTASGNGRPGGIVVEGAAPANKLRGNTANSNAGYGISAIGGTIDAGGNRAHGNRRAPQCVGVACA
jgi:parallel beta-helix repeat protein